MLQVQYYKAIPYLVAGVLAMIGTLLLLLVPETANRPLLEELPPRTFCLCCANVDDEPGSPVEENGNVHLVRVTTTETPEDRIFSDDKDVTVE